MEDERNKVETKASSCNFLQSHSVKWDNCSMHTFNAWKKVNFLATCLMDKAQALKDEAFHTCICRIKESCYTKCVLIFNQKNAT